MTYEELKKFLANKTQCEITIFFTRQLEDYSTLFYQYKLDTIHNSISVSATNGGFEMKTIFSAEFNEENFEKLKKVICEVETKCENLSK